MSGQDLWIDIGIQLHIRVWNGDKAPFVLVHGLSSNCYTWEAVAEQLALAGHQVITVDQRGHGLSDKPDDDYDYATVTADLARLLIEVEVEKPIIVGQSWGGNVLLEFGARYPDIPRGLGFIDGGFLDFRANPDATWEKVSEELKPPRLVGMPREALKDRIQQMHPDWSEMGVEGTLGNFEVLPDGSVRPWLTLERHMKILRAMWEQSPAKLYPQVQSPVLICPASDSPDSDWTKRKQKLIQIAQAGLPRSRVHWFEKSDHDIHVQRPNELANLFLHTLEQGIWQ